MSRLIDADALIAWIKGSQQMTSKMKAIICYIKTMPTTDLVRCKECKHRTYCYGDVLWTNKRQTVDIHKTVDFCSFGEREGE